MFFIFYFSNREVGRIYINARFHTEILFEKHNLEKNQNNIFEFNKNL